MEASCVKVWWLRDLVSQSIHPFRPWLMEQVLATISAGHQKAAGGVAGVDTGTQVKNNGSHNRISGQEGYEATL